MSEIEKEDDSDMEKDNVEDNIDEEHGNTSVDTMMEDTPSNYNIINQRFENEELEPVEPLTEEDSYEYVEEEVEIDDDDDEDEENEEDATLMHGSARKRERARLPKKKIIKRRRKKKPKKKKVVEVFNDPNDNDIELAKAYGG